MKKENGEHRLPACWFWLLAKTNFSLTAQPLGKVTYSPSALICYLAPPFGSWLDRYGLDGLSEIKPDEQTEEEKLLSLTGDEHEESVLKRYKAAGTGLIEIPKDQNKFDAAHAATLEAIKIIGGGCRNS